jgi:hypothetical protein
VNRFEKWSVLLTSAAVILTGLIYAWMKYLLPSPDGFSIIHHPLQPLVLKLHVLTAPLLVFALGAIAVRHVWRHYRADTKLGRRSGLSTAILLAPMTLSGYLLQVITGEQSLRILVVGHITTGLLYAAVLVLHQIIIARSSVSLGEFIARGDRRPRPPRKASTRRVPLS